jgi:hypothetical protein
MTYNFLLKPVTNLTSKLFEKPHSGCGGGDGSSSYSNVAVNNDQFDDK